MSIMPAPVLLPPESEILVFRGNTPRELRDAIRIKPECIMCSGPTRSEAYNSGIEQLREDAQVYDSNVVVVKRAIIDPPLYRVAMNWLRSQPTDYGYILVADFYKAGPEDFGRLYRITLR